MSVIIKEQVRDSVNLVPRNLKGKSPGNKVGHSVLV